MKVKLLLIVTIFLMFQFILITLPDAKQAASKSGADLIIELIKQKKAGEVVLFMDNSLKLTLIHENRVMTGQDAVKESESNLKWIMKRFREVKKISNREIEVLGTYFEGNEEMWQSRLMILFIEEKNGKTVIKEIKLEVGGMG